MDYLHDTVDEGLHPNFNAALRAFQSQGCEGVGLTCSTGNDSDTAAMADAMYDLLGDDIDGAAAMMEDFMGGY